MSFVIYLEYVTSVENGHKLPVLAPASFRERLSKEPERLLNKAEKEIYERDGVLVLREVISKDVLDFFLEAKHRVHWWYGEAAKDLLEVSTLAALAASALDVPSVRLFDMTFFTMPGSPLHWHTDLKETPGRLLPHMNTWLALTDGPNALEFILRSHYHWKHNCSTAFPRQNYGPSNDCIAEYHNNLTKQLGFEAHKGFDFKPGDVALFQGQIWHRGVPSGTEVRHGVVFRFVPSDATWERSQYQTWNHHPHHHLKPADCEEFSGPLFPIVYPRERSTLKWPLTDLSGGVRRLLAHFEWLHVDLGKKCGNVKGSRRIDEL